MRFFNFMAFSTYPSFVGRLVVSVLSFIPLNIYDLCAVPRLLALTLSAAHVQDLMIDSLQIDGLTRGFQFLHYRTYHKPSHLLPIGYRHPGILFTESYSGFFDS